MNWLEKIAFPAMNAPIPEISPQEAYNTCRGPFYHGTSPEKIDSIIEQGFKWEEGEHSSGDTAHGYGNRPYMGSGTDCPPPVHHLGYGIYFTANKSIAKDFGYGSTRNLVEVYILKSARMTEINWGAPTTMMKWWRKMGYDCELAKKDRVAATKLLTEKLAQQYDAIYYKGKGIRRLIDGDQLCVYNPSMLRRVNKSLVQPGERGSRVRRKSDGMIGILLRRTPIEEHHPGETEFLTVKWKKGGVEMNVYSSQVEFL
jgi:hypothetical protein